MDDIKLAQKLIASAMGTLGGVFPMKDSPETQKRYLESALERLSSAIDALDRAQKPTAADMARTVDASSQSSGGENGT